MRLGYFCYTTGNTEIARLALYHGEPVDIYLGETKFTLFAPMISVGPVMPQAPFTLVAKHHNERIGTCQGTFIDNKILLIESTGVFAGLLVYALTEQETLRAIPFGNCPGLPSTNIILLSRKWEEYQLIVGKKGVEHLDVEYWDDDGIHAKHWIKRQRCTGWSTRYNGSSAECSAALVAVVSGRNNGKAGWLLMGGNVGLQIGGAPGVITGALWVPNLSDFPGKISDFDSKGYIGVPPISVMPELDNTRRRGA